MWAVLRRRDFALLWSGTLVSDTGDWLLIVGLPIYVFTTTGSSLGTAIVFIVELVPALLLGSVAGVFVDRWDLRRTMIAVNLVQAVLLLPLLAAGPDRMWIVYAVAGVEATLAQLFNPAKAALLPRLVERADLAVANSLVSVNESLARLVGSPLGGLVVDTLGLHWIVVVDAVSFVAAALLVACVRPAVARRPAGQATAREGTWTSWRAGLRTVRSNRTLSGLFVIGVVSQIAQGLFVVLFVVFISRELGGSGADIGLVRGVQAIGGILGGIFVGSLARRVAPRSLVGYGALVLGAVALTTWNLSAVTDVIAVYAALFVVAGVPIVAFAAGLNTAAQLAAPADQLGRVFGAYGSVTGAAQAIGLAAGGVLADRVGVVPTLNGQALLYVATGLLAFRLLPRSVQSGSIGTVIPESLPSSTARVTADEPNRARTPSRASSSAPPA